MNVELSCEWTRHLVKVGEEVIRNKRSYLGRSGIYLF